MEYEKNYFNASDLDVEPLIINRKLSTFDHPIIIVQAASSHPTYESIVKFIQYSLLDLQHGSSFLFDFIKPEYKFKSDRIYTIDMRKEKDAELETLEIANYDLAPTWVKNFIFNSVINATRGLVIFCDNYKDIPNSVLTRSILCLTEETDSVKLREFLARIGHGINSFPELSPNIEAGILRGTYKGVHWMKKVIYS